MWYEEEPFLATMVVEMGGDNIVKSTEILKGRYVGLQGYKMGEYVEQHVRI
jgi:hypothetical protein